MYSYTKKFPYLFIIVIALMGCKHGNNKSTSAFYYWKSAFDLSGQEEDYLHSLGVHKLYLHFFDVSWNEQLTKALPVARMKFETVPDNKFQFVPVVFILNKALDQTPDDSITSLARHILNEIDHIASDNDISYKELQFDCDWTDGTRDKYFKLLSFFHDGLKKAGKILSATIRLHQVKYADKTGVPPVDRGMLMFYNMGKVNSVPGYNSIYNDKNANLYASYISSYALPLDVALPVFSWAVCARRGRVSSIIEKVSDSDFADTSMFSSSGNGIFVSNRSFFFRGKYFMKNDTVKIEQVSPGLCKEAATNVSRYLKNENRTISLFDYDPQYLTNYDKKDILEIFNSAN
ncbi:MAG TPA: hypothetical protein VK806_05805 [Bacteroidia bacterium]|jgi:hypothetical protein|nr:hypothetical protein [Bacteroidia bacterium]